MMKTIALRVCIYGNKEPFVLRCTPREAASVLALKGAYYTVVL